jgi:hypothetical protein
MKTIQASFVATVAAAWVSVAGAITISDPTDWAGAWAFSSVNLGGVGTASATVEAAGGNPGPRLNITTVTPTVFDQAHGLALYQGASTVAPLTGTPFVMQFGVLSGAGAFGQGQEIWILVEQAGSIYFQSLGVTGFPLNAFTTQNYNGAFNPGGFNRIVGAGPATPAFDGVTATRYGFAAGNSGSATLTQYYDNWNLTFVLPVAPVAAVPVMPPALLAFLAALLAVAGWRTLRRPG